MPYRILAAIMVIEGILVLLFAAFPPDERILRHLNLSYGLVLLAGGAIVWLVGPRVPRGWPLDVAIASNATLVCIGAAGFPRDLGQLSAGMGLVLLGAFAGYFRGPRRVWRHLALMLVLYAAALLYNPLLATPLYFLFVGGIVVGVTVMVSTLSESLRREAMHDSLTGLLNRRGLDLLAGPVLAAAARSGSPVTVGILDLDRFKQYNDQHGHLAGDGVLVALAQAWLAEARTSDLVARFGGDEFAVVLPGARVDDAHDLVGRVRAHGCAPWSIGLAEWSADEDLPAALDRADRNLYAAKGHPLDDPAVG